MYVDTHCHLDHHFALDVDEQVRLARQAQVTTMITVGTDVASSRQAVATASRFDGIYAAVGIHPNDAHEADTKSLAILEELTADPSCVAVGETGLDYYWDKVSPAQQDQAFRAQISLAKRSNKTLVIHCRDAWADTLNVLHQEGAPDRVVMHCYSGNLEETKRCIDAGYFMSFAGNVTFKNAQDLRDSAAIAPLELMLTETDSPYLTPHPFRGKPNDPSYVPVTAALLAQVAEVDVARLAAAVQDNVQRAFDLPPGNSVSS